MVYATPLPRIRIGLDELERTLNALAGVALRLDNLGLGGVFYFGDGRMTIRGVVPGHSTDQIKESELSSSAALSQFYVETHDLRHSLGSFLCQCL